MKKRKGIEPLVILQQLEEEISELKVVVASQGKRIMDLESRPNNSSNNIVNVPISNNETVPISERR